MSETIAHPETQEAPRPVEVVELIHVVESLDVNRAALVWRNCLVRNHGWPGTYTALTELRDDIQAAAQQDQDIDLRHLEPVLSGATGDAGTLKADLLDYLHALQTIPVFKTKEAIITSEALAQIQLQCTHAMDDLSRSVKLLESQHVIHPDVLELLQGYKRLQYIFERRPTELDIKTDYIWYYNRHREALALYNRVEALLNPFRAHEHTNT